MGRHPADWIIEKISNDDIQYVVDALLERIEPPKEVEPKIGKIETFYEAAKERQENKDKLCEITTGIPSLDEILYGFEREELITIGGKTSNGKTLLAQNIIFNNAQRNKKCLIFSLEMSLPEIGSRFLTMSKDLWKGSTDEETGKEVWEEFAKSYPIYYFKGTNNPSMEEVEINIKHAVDKEGIELVVIDHLGFLTHNLNNRANEVGDIVRRIKGFAREYRIPIVLISHVRKTQGAMAADIDDLKDSSSIAQDSDVVIMVNKEDNPQGNVIDVAVRKSRNRGRIGSTKLIFDDGLILKPYTDPFF